jgi:hypothetical protein
LNNNFLAYGVGGDDHPTPAGHQKGTGEFIPLLNIAHNISAGEHPRIWLDSETLSTLRQRAVAATPEWVALKSRCDEHLTGTVEWPDGDDYPGDGSIGEGYQGDGYFHPLLNLGLCYQVVKEVEPAKAPFYAAKGVEILVKMSEPPDSPHSVNPLRDDGYGIRYFGVGMAIGYDWFYNAMTPEERTRVYQALNYWIAEFDAGGFERDHPQGNYFAGYYAAKALAALATEGDNPEAPAQWDDWLNRLHGQMVQPYYADWLAGGGWPEGWNYGPLGTLNMCWPILAVKTAKGLDLIHGERPFIFPIDQGLYLIHFTWPNRLTLDDRGGLYAGDNPSGTRPSFFTSLSGLLGFWQADSAPVFHSFAREVRTTPGTNEEELDSLLWQEFLFWDDAAPEQDVNTLPLSYFARGTNMAGTVAVRSSWATDAVWASFTSAPYIAYPACGHEYFDQGSLAIVHGGTPLLVNATGALLRNTPGTNDGDTWEDLISADLWDDTHGRW